MIGRLTWLPRLARLWGGSARCGRYSAVSGSCRRSPAGCDPSLGAAAGFPLCGAHRSACVPDRAEPGIEIEHAIVGSVAGAIRSRAEHRRACCHLAILVTIQALVPADPLRCRLNSRPTSSALIPWRFPACCGVPERSAASARLDVCDLRCFLCATQLDPDPRHSALRQSRPVPRTPIPPRSATCIALVLRMRPTHSASGGIPARRTKRFFPPDIEGIQVGVRQSSASLPATSLTSVRTCPSRSRD